MTIKCTSEEKEELLDLILTSIDEGDGCGCQFAECDYQEREKMLIEKGWTFSHWKFCKGCLEKNIKWIIEEE